MQPRRMIGIGAALLTLSLGGAAFAQPVPAEPYMPPPVQPISPGSPGPVYAPPYQPPAAYPGQPYQPAPPSQPGQPVYVYPPGSQPGMAPPPPNYMPPQGQPVSGYKMAPRTGLVIAGSVVLGGMWLITAAAGGIATATCDVFGNNTCTYWPLFVPVAGPFIQMGFIAKDDPLRSVNMVALAFDGLVQVGGLTMLLLGVTLKHRVPVYAQKYQVAPMFTSSGSGLAFSGRF